MTATKQGQNQIALTWQDNTDKEDGYIVERTIKGISKWTAINLFPKDEQSSIADSLLPATSYSFRVLAYTQSGARSNPSNIASSTTDRDPKIPWGTILSVSGLEGVKSDTITFNYELKLDTGENSYTTDWQVTINGEDWTALSSSDILNNTSTSPGLRSLQWLSLNTFDAIDSDSAWFRMKYQSGSNISSFIYSPIFHLDNNLPPSTTILPLVEEQNSNPFIEFSTQDVEGDSITYTAEYKTPNDTIWNAASINFNVTEYPSLPSKVTSKGFINWSASKDLPVGYSGNVSFRATPSDNDLGNISNQIQLNVDYNYPPVAQIANISSPQVSEVKFAYTISDQEQDTLNLQVNYNIGFGWFPATIIEKIDTTTTYSGILTWRSMSDVDPILYPSVQLQIIPFDKDEGTSANSNEFQLDNDQLPKAYVLSSGGERSGDIEINYRLSDKQSDKITFAPEYSTDLGVNWTGATITGQIENIILTDTSQLGSIIWNSLVDLPEKDIINLQFRIVPEDVNGKGFSRSIGVYHLDNNTPPIVQLTALNGEQSEDIIISYQIIDPSEGDSFSLEGSISSNQGIAWTNIGTFNINTKKTGEIIWKSKESTDGVDEKSFYLRLLPSDLDSGIPDTIIFHLDNEVGPQLVNSNQNIIPIPGDPIKLEFSLPLNRSSVFDAITVTSNMFGPMGNLQFSYENQDRTIYISSTDGIPSLDELTIYISNSLKDTDNKGFDGNRNGDPQYSAIDDTTLIIKTYLGADLDGSGKLNLSDINLFIDAWNVDDYSYEIGPVNGSLPNLRLIPDQQFNIDDMMTFIRYWNWAKVNGMVSGKIIDTVGTIDNSIVFTNQDNRIQVQSLLDKSISDFHISMNYDNPNISYNEPLITSKNLNSSTLILAANDSLNNSYNYFFGFLNYTNNNFSDSSLFEVPVKIKGRNNQNIEIVYEYTFEGNRYLGKQLVTIVPIPESFALNQNFPNPFNPNTTIFYDLPIDTYIKLSVYDILGREVVTLINEHQIKGYKSFKWNGQDKNGKKLGSGVYFYQLQANNFIKTKKMIMLK